jgi:hypothetical protein
MTLLVGSVETPGPGDCYTAGYAVLAVLPVAYSRPVRYLGKYRSSQYRRSYLSHVCLK